MRLLLILSAAFFAACSPPPPPAEKAQTDPTTEPWYSQTVDQLAAMDRDAGKLLQSGQSDQAAAIITRGQPFLNRLLSVPRPTLAAMEAVSDLDQLYGQMLLGNHYYGSARLLFQKNVTRWRTWKPQTPDTARRLKLALSGIAECDRHIE
ncbi:MAG TPA: hypothetical protein VLY04_09930 [Bryobacteraceae bacterium]|nr:hypothetical protein [Bryobacteraceae bacterium]